MQIQATQNRQLTRFLKQVSRQSRFYRNLPPVLGEFPIMDKALFLQHFSDLNRCAITLNEATNIALKAEHERNFRPELPGYISVGLSSGTSGFRHVFLVDRLDRCRWAGQMLARILTTQSLHQILSPFHPPLRIAFFLRANNNLYTTISGRRVQLQYYDLTRPFDTLVDELSRQAPQMLVAPATVLAELAKHEQLSPRKLHVQQIVSVAEVLDSNDRALVESTFGAHVAEVYQATEGFLGSSCKSGRVHLNEDTLHIEPEWLDDQMTRFHPIITDFSRHTQWFVRYRLSDILHIYPMTCSCGQSTISLQNIEGRAEEVLWLKNSQGTLSPIFPDVLRQSLYSMTLPLDLYRIEQHGAHWEIRLRHSNETLQKATQAALKNMIEALRLEMPSFHFFPWTDQPVGEKQKRIRCISKPL